MELEPGTSRPPTKLTIDVVRKGTKKGPYALEHAAPVTTGDLLSFSVPLPPDRFASLFHYSEGNWVRCEHYFPEGSLRTVTHPKPGERVPLLGKAGTEFFLFCRGKKADRCAGVANDRGGDAPFPTLPNGLAFFTLNEQESKAWTSRGVTGPPVKSNHPEDIAYRQLDQIRGSIRPHFDIFAGVLFVHKGPEE